ncbi:hypothetical protein GGTG_04812 [Gaeumannomyces tritici R3-111a-1]|uniref:Uncharacterized protein n=1 Tax=Gaeumannomyces tritici (strain R3-111a-1) TaxID=644352 RepID=J3NU57_GAET3|nr:hypothetical protein GGTG_04812 [Gaeumannomyces tritici R3-111a-1]EJT79728.1 hypothetical protein GGTG_04812 [Gaeumannomyces tritici R3-111a-1]
MVTQRLYARYINAKALKFMLREKGTVKSFSKKSNGRDHCFVLVGKGKGLKGLEKSRGKKKRGINRKRLIKYGAKARAFNPIILNSNKR